MIKDNFDFIIVFTSHHRALYMYDRLRLKNIKSKLVTAPNKVNISCTQALKIKEEDQDVVKIELDRNNIYPTAVFKIIKTSKGEDYELVE